MNYFPHKQLIYMKVKKKKKLQCRTENVNNF